MTEHRGPPNSRSRAPFKVLVEDDTGDVELVFFLANHEWVRSRLPVGATRWISGKLELWDGRRQMVHPDRVMTAEELDRLPSVEPVYGLTDGLYQRTVARAAEGALKRLPPLPEWISEKTLSDLKLPSFAASARRDAPSRDSRRISTRPVRRRRGSPMTSSSPTSSRSFSCGRACASFPAERIGLKARWRDASRQPCPFR